MATSPDGIKINIDGVGEIIIDIEKHITGSFNVPIEESIASFKINHISYFY